MKSAIGIGALLMDGLGDTIRVSLTEDPEFELSPCAELAQVSYLPLMANAMLFTLLYLGGLACTTGSLRASSLFT